MAKAEDKRCVVASTKNLFSRFHMPFSSPFSSTAGGNAFTCQYVTQVLRSTLQDLSYTGHYTGHSFCRGAATWVRKIDFTDAGIQLLGRWASDPYLLYIDTSPAVLLNASRRLQH